MENNIKITNYDPNEGFIYIWEPNFEIDVKYDSGTVVLTANTAELISMANHLLNLAQNAVPSGYHLHFNDINSLNKGSIEFIVEKKD